MSASSEAGSDRDGHARRTQLISNVSRAYILRAHVYWRGFFYYVGGSLVAYAVTQAVSFTPERLVVFLGLGLTPFIAALLPSAWLDSNVRALRESQAFKLW